MNSIPSKTNASLSHLSSDKPQSPTTPPSLTTPTMWGSPTRFSMIRQLRRVVQSYKGYSAISRNFYSSKLLFARTVNSLLPMEPVDIDGLRAAVVKQGGVVRQLKKDGASQEDVTAGTSFSSPYPPAHLL